MATINSPFEVWQRGPIADMPDLLQPVAHTLLQAKEEVNLMVTNFQDNLLWQSPEGMATAGFHLQHLSGVLDRVFTYARADKLSLVQIAFLEEEKNPPKQNLSIQILVDRFNNQIENAVFQLQNTNPDNLIDLRTVGRKMIATTLIGLLFHAAEHTMRHVGQLMVTIKFVQYQNDNSKLA